MFRRKSHILDDSNEETASGFTPADFDSVPPVEALFEGDDSFQARIAGADASVFAVDAATGDVRYQNWFKPNYDEVWDMDRDHIYEVSVIGTDADGTQVFDGSIDWHSSAHAHLANVAAFEANSDQAGLQAFAADRFTAEDVQVEIDLNIDDPYGWAWLLKLDTKLQDNGIDNLAPAGEHFAAELEADLATQIANGTYDLGDGS